MHLPERRDPPDSLSAARPDAGRGLSGAENLQALLRNRPALLFPREAYNDLFGAKLRMGELAG